MAAKKIFFENYLDVPMYVFLRTNKGRLEIHVFDEQTVGVTEIGPSKRVAFDLSSLVGTCIRNNSLAFTLVGHNGKIRCTISPGRDRLPEGPVFAITPVEN